MIAFRNFALRRGERLLLSQVDLSLHAGWRIGVIGRNGCGKSSLFAAVMGEVEADQGDIDLPGKVRIASVAQETPSLPDAAIDFVLSGDTEVNAILQAEAAAMAAEDWDAVANCHQRLAGAWCGGGHFLPLQGVGPDRVVAHPGMHGESFGSCRQGCWMLGTAGEPHPSPG